MGSISLCFGIQLVGWGAGSPGNEGPAYLFGALTGVALISIAIWRRRGAALGFGAAAIVIFVPQLLYAVFQDTVGVPIALLFAGILLVAMAVLVIVVRPKVRSTAQALT
jgi:hypothetical protein